VASARGRTDPFMVRPLELGRDLVRRLRWCGPVAPAVAALGPGCVKTGGPVFARILEADDLVRANPAWSPAPPPAFC
jgi:hypothetical protein